MEVDLEGSGDPPLPQPQYQFHAMCVRLDLEKIDILEKGVSKIGQKNLILRGYILDKFWVSPHLLKKMLGRVQRPQIRPR